MKDGWMDGWMQEKSWELGGPDLDQCMVEKLCFIKRFNLLIYTMTLYT